MSVWWHIQMVFETNGNANKIPQTKFPPPSSVVPSSILCQPLLYDVIPDRGQVVSSAVSDLNIFYFIYMKRKSLC